MCMLWLFHIVIFGIILIHWNGTVTVVSALQSLVALEVFSMMTSGATWDGCGLAAVAVPGRCLHPCTRTNHVSAIMRSLQCNQCQDSMRQINPDGFQSLRYSMYDYDFVAINIFELSLSLNVFDLWLSECVYIWRDMTTHNVMSFYCILPGITCIPKCQRTKSII